MASKVRVRLVQDTVTKKVELEVAVQSNQRRGLWAVKKVDADASDLETLVSKAAAECAILQIVQYRDKHDPDDCARVAREALAEIKADAERAYRKVISLPDHLR